MKYAHIVTSTTHKTLRGPRGGIILIGKDFPNPWGKTTPKGEIKMMSQLLDSAVFPGIQGGPLEHVIAAKAVAFGEVLQPEYKEYAGSSEEECGRTGTSINRPWLYRSFPAVQTTTPCWSTCVANILISQVKLLKKHWYLPISL